MVRKTSSLSRTPLRGFPSKNQFRSLLRYQTKIAFERLEERLVLAADLGMHEIPSFDNLPPNSSEFISFDSEDFSPDANGSQVSDDIKEPTGVDQHVVRTPVPGELVVGINRNLDSESQDSLLTFETFFSNEFPTIVDYSLDSMFTTQENIELVHIEYDGAAELDEILAASSELDAVAWIAPNYQYTGDIRDFVPNDPEYVNQYHHQLMNQELAWDSTLGDPNVIIAITDDGLEMTHPDIIDNVYVNTVEANGFPGFDDDNNGYIDDISGFDFVSNDNDASPVNAGDTHGTHVAGIAAGRTNNGNQIAGVAGLSSIMPIRIAGSDGGFTSTIMANAFQFGIDTGARIMNTSYNINGFAGDPTFTAGLQYYYDNGGLHFNSAGNGNELNPARQVFHQTMLVVSTDANDFRSSFSNYGTGVDISAPGSSVLSTVTGGGLAFNSGTSMAAPNAAGVAALIWAQNPSYNRDQVAAQLAATADNIDGVNPGFEGLLGAGRVNSGRALTETIGAPKVETFDGLPADGEVIGSPLRPIEEFAIEFDQIMAPASVNNPANFELIGAGSDDIFGNADDIVFPLTYTNYLIGTNTLEFSIGNGGLAELGQYRFTASSGLENPFGTDLDGNGDGTGGDSFSSTFSIEQLPLEAIDPLGSLIYDPPQSGSIGVAGEVDTFTYELDPGQTITLTFRSADTLQGQIRVVDPSNTQLAIASASAAGEQLLIQTVPNTTGGTYEVEITGLTNTTGSYTYELILNAAIEEESVGLGGNDVTADAQDLSPTFIQLGSGAASRGAVMGGSALAGDNFESGALDGSWTTSSSAAVGRIQVTDAFGAAGGSFALLMDVTTDGNNNLNEAIWTVDLSGVATPILRFFHNDFGDEQTSLPATFAGSFNGDGVAFSVDGTNWHTILNATNVTGWTEVVVDMGAAAAAAGVTLGANTQIKFQQFDNFALPTDGRGYDEIEIVGGADWYSFQVNDGETASIVYEEQGGVPNVELYYDDPTGGPTLVATGVSSSNLTGVINNYEDKTTNGVPDTYFVQVQANSTYSLVVTKNADFDTEGNNTFATAQDPDAALGYIDRTSTADANILTDFPGIDAIDSFCGCQPPDTHAAAGMNHIVEVVNTAVAVYDKLGNVLMAPIDIRNFFSPAVVDGDQFLFDPVVSYMEDVGRFAVAVLSGATAGAAETDLLVAVSDSDDAMGGWTEQQRIDFGGVSPGLFADYPKVGWNADSLVYTLNMFGGSFVDVNIVSLDKASLLDANTATVNSFISERPGTSFTMAAATMHASAAGSPMWLVEESGFGGTRSDIRVVKMENNLSASPAFTDYLVPVSSYGSGGLPAAPQPGGTRRTNDARMMNAEWRGDRLVATHSANIGGETKVRWYEFDTSVATPTLSQEGLIDPGPGVATYFPSIAINAAGDLGLTYMQSSASEFSSMYVAGQVFGADPGTTSAPGLAKAGDQTFVGSRSGDYSGITVDPVTDSFWAANEVSLGGAPDPIWSTHIAEFVIAPIFDKDFYSFSVNAGDNLSLRTFTPFDGPGEPFNTLDPSIELLAPDGTSVGTDDNSAGDGRNALLTHAATQTGQYRVAVGGAVAGTAGFSGEYFVSINGATGDNPAPSVIDVDPDDTGVVGAFPATITLDFSESIDIRTVAAADVSIGGLPATSLTILDGDTFEFGVDPAANIGDGNYTIAIAAAAVSDLQGQPLAAAFQSVFTLDTTGPRITATTWNGAAFPASRIFAPGPLTVTATMTEDLSTNRSARVGLRSPGADDVILLDTTTGARFVPTAVDFNVGTLTFSAEFGELPHGNYELTLVSGDGAFEDVIGNDLDGEAVGAGADGAPTGDGTPGGNYTIGFTVDGATQDAVPPVDVLPLGSMMGDSIANSIFLHDAADVDGILFFAEAGETISAHAIPDPLTGTPTISLTLVGVSGTVTGTPGSSVTIAPVTIPADGVYELRVATNAVALVDVEIIRNGATEAAIGDSEDGMELSIDGTFVEVGSGRYGVMGTSNANPEPTFTKYNDPSLFVDISGTGTALNLTDDGEANITTTVGNSIFPAGTVRVGNNGAIMASSTGNVFAGNGTLPATSLEGTALVPFWDDIDSDTGNTYWQEVQVNGINTLIVQWHERPHFSNTGSVTFQLQLFETGPIGVRYVYPDVDFGNAAWDFGASATIGYQETTSSAIQFSFNTPVLANGDVLDLVLSSPPDVDEYTVDLTGKVGSQLDVLFTGIGTDFSGQGIDLLDPSGTVLASGITNPLGVDATNYDLGILDFTVPVDGVYTVRTSSSLPGPYSVLVTEDVLFDSEPNDAATNLRNLETIEEGMGHVATGVDIDNWQVNLNANDVVAYELTALLAHAGHDPINDLDPQITVIHPDGTTVVASDQDSLDGRNARVVFTAPVTGAYTLRVSGETGAGEYLLSSAPVDLVPPGVSDVIVASSTWSAAFIDTVDGGGAGAGNALGYSLLNNAARPLPWNDIDRIFVLFTEDVVGVIDSNFELRDSNGVLSTSVAYASATFMATLTTPVLEFSKLRLGVSDSVTDIIGNALDGDGNNVAGGIFDLRLDVVPGDGNGDGRVNGGDLGAFAAAFLTQAGQANFNPFVDWNADDRVNGSDLAVFSANFLNNIGTLSEPAGAFSGGGGGGEGNSSDDKDDYSGFDSYFGGFGDDEEDDENMFGLF